MNLGKLGEGIAVRHLKGKGYVILEQDWRSGHRDIDIVCMKDDITIFVEVKTRSTDVYGQPDEAVDRQKMQNILHSANSYMKFRQVSGPVRFDIISVVIRGEEIEVHHYPDAFNPYSLTQF